jgi:Ca2+-binding EF-hand superfamily protein
VADEFVRLHPTMRSTLQKFLDENIERIFERFDANGDGRVTQEELHERSIALKEYVERMRSAPVAAHYKPQDL